MKRFGAGQPGRVQNGGQRAGGPWEPRGVRVMTVPGAGHNIMLDRPDASAAAVAGRG